MQKEKRIDTIIKNDTLSPQETLSWAYNTFGNRVSILTSFQLEGLVIIDMAYTLKCPIRVVTIDTGRLNSETHTLIDQIREKYNLEIETFFPNHDSLNNMVSKFGTNPFYKSVSLRLMCCQIRKVDPMKQILLDNDAWITGIRRSQTITRNDITKIQKDTSYEKDKIKINPLADWTYEQVWEYIKEKNIPYNELYDKGYTSIGCAPCTRPIKTNEDIRSGRWWWEKGEMPKECGLHVGPSWGRSN